MSSLAFFNRACGSVLKVNPVEIVDVITDATKEKDELDWELTVKFHELVRIIVNADLELVGLESSGKGQEIIEKRFSGLHRWEDQVVSMGR